jgi:hypothetical protein
MSLRINLIKEDEVRHAGLLSEAFVFRVLAAVLVALVAIGAVLLMLHVRNIRRDLKSSRRLFNQKDVLYQDIRAMQMDITDNKRLLEELDGWHISRMDWDEALMNLAAVVPPSIQMSRMTVRGDIQMPRAQRGQRLQKAPLPFREYKIILDGTSEGELADEVVVQFIRLLKESPGFKDLFESVNLQRIERMKASGRDTEEDDVDRRVFAIESMTRPLEMPGGVKPAGKEEEK